MTSSDPTSQSSTAVDSEEAAIHEKALAKGNSDQSTEQSTEAQNPSNGFWPVFLSTFVTIFLAELGDKTQVTTMLMSAESKAPVVVFLGAGLALISTSLIGVLLGQ
ncbi:MAG: TMEM165/GDT1 family protein, partial [Cyanobacteria bacterium P01_D01_bin.36]